MLRRHVKSLAALAVRLVAVKVSPPTTLAPRPRLGLLALLISRLVISDSLASATSMRPPQTAGLAMLDASPPKLLIYK